jgi:hypothetical protein
MFTQKSLPGLKINCGRVPVVGVPGASQCSVKHREHGVDRGQDVRFCAPQKRKACSRELELQRSERLRNAM